ncbi:MAG: hypothetical protein ABJD68_01495 [Nakamurella sp.]
MRYSSGGLMVLDGVGVALPAARGARPPLLGGTAVQSRRRF